MKLSRRRWMMALAAFAAIDSHAAEPFTRLNVVLLQPSAVLEARTSVDAMADYIRAIERAASDAVAAAASRQSTGGFVVVAVRPGGQSKAWLDFDTLLDLDVRKRLRDAVQGVPAMTVREGPVVFALKVALWGGKESRRSVPTPPEWKQAGASGPAREVGELVESIWDSAP
ncbi:hypothetical protein AACH06_22860 [Ideonella sp. DXS29W]|uniref:Uncharacterized protein n=1 Tax=Ideonella lacteola TaxID=2984193 RepID=A0ABU9BX22_9BURK